MKKFLIVLLVILGVVLVGFSKTVTLEFWTLSLSPTFDNYIKSIIEDFEKHNPGIKVNWVDIPYSAAVEKLTAAIAARKAPDIVNLNTSWALDFIAQDALESLDEYIPESVRYVYWEKLWESTMINGKSYAVPWYASVPIMMYNKELFERAGLDPDTPPQTWEEVTEIARKIKEMTGAYGLEPNIIALDELLLEGIPVVSADGKKAIFNTPEAVKKLKWFQMLYTENLMPRSLGGYVEGRQKYSAGQLAMYPAGLTMLKHIEVNSPEIYKVTDVTTYPTGKARLVKVSLMNLAIPFTSKHKGEAAKFILWVTSPYWQVKFSNYATIIPSTKVGLDTDPEFIRKAESGDLKAKAMIMASKAMKFGVDLNSPLVHRIPLDKYSEFRRILQSYWIAAIKGEYTAEEALKKAEEECNKLLGR